MLETPLQSRCYSLGNNATVRDNQQATRVGWFVGILEGEGAFRHTPKNNREARISNTDLDIVSACENFLRANNIYFSTSSGTRDGRKTEYTISVCNSKYEIFQYSEILFKLISPVMECRLNEYQRILGAPETTCDPSVDLDWMAGIYEAEGSFNLVFNNCDIAAAKIDLANTNERILSKVLFNLKAMGCSWYIRDKVSEKSHHKQCQVIEIHGMRRCSRFLTAMDGRWVAAQNQRLTTIMSSFIQSRFSRPVKAHYTPEEVSMVQSMRDLNRR